MKSIIKSIRLLFGGYAGLICLRGIFISFSEKFAAQTVNVTLIFGGLTVLLIKPSKKKEPPPVPEIIQTNEQSDQELLSTSDVVPTNEQGKAAAEYIETGNMMYSADSQPISDGEVSYLIQVEYEKALERENAIQKRTSREYDLCFNFEMNHSSEIDNRVNKFEELCTKHMLKKILI